eukprot:1754283-Lingulodinium_polyedra.AAC.1
MPPGRGKHRCAGWRGQPWGRPQGHGHRTASGSPAAAIPAVASAMGAGDGEPTGRLPTRARGPLRQQGCC